MLKGTVAAPGQLTEEQIARVEGKFSKLLGQEVSLSLRVDPSLIGGLRVEIDGRLYDGTIKKQLTITDGNEEVDSSSEAGFEWLEKLGASDKKSGGISEEELNEQGIYSNTIRLSIGTENIDDIIEDLEGGFQSV